MSKVGKIIKYFFTFLIILFCTMIILRICMHDDQSLFKSLYVDDTLRTAYFQSGEDFKVLTHKIAEIISEDGSFIAYNMRYTPTANRLQIAVRYNDGVIDSVQGEDYSSDKAPFSFTLIDNNGVSYSPNPNSQTAHKYMYNYVMLIFDNVNMDNLKDGENFSIRMHISDTPDESNVLATLPIHYGEQPFEEYKLSSSEKKALSE